MRTIRFRAWDTVQKKMTGTFGFEDITGEDGNEGYIQAGEQQITSYKINNKQFKFMQFTGLKDKNGKEIWESDILLRPAGNILKGEQWKEVKAPVRYVAEHGGFCWADWRLDKSIAATCEVVGNAYEGDI